MATLATQRLPLISSDKQDDWSQLQCPVSSFPYSARPFPEQGDQISFQCPFTGSSSTSTITKHSQQFPVNHPPIPRGISPRSEPSSTPSALSSGVPNASDILPILPHLVVPNSSGTDVEHEITQGNFAHLYSDDLDRPSLILQQTLRDFRAKSTRYATERYDDAFNWKDLEGLPIEMHREWYCVVFRSKRKASSSNISLYSADRAAHYEAIEGGGLIMYWYGEPDDQGQNLATCVWQSRAQALEGTRGPRHIDAMRQAAKAYESFTLERWVLRKERGKTRLSLEPWVEGEVNLGTSIQRGRSRETKKLSI